MNEHVETALGAVGDPVEFAGSCIVLPVRHHSPACAWHVDRVIRDQRPDCVLIEGPSDANDRWEALLDAKTMPPVAIYGFVRGEESASACFYPFCSHSPEYVAARAGRDMNAEIAFIDLPSWWMARLRQGGPLRTNAYADVHLRHHGYLEVLCRQTRTRDFDELWDHLFESNGPELGSDVFFTQVATYCRIAREHSDPRILAQEGNDVRESFMAARIQERLKAGKRVVAVVGGLHRSGLQERLQGKSKPPKSPKPPKRGTFGSYLTIYGFQQLDRWSGYQSGMVAPEFRYRVWHSLSGQPERESEQLLRDACQAVRDAGDPLSTVDLISAASMLHGLVRMRGHSRPTLDDVRDAVRTAWTKGSEQGGAIGVVERFLIGKRVGRVSSRAGRPPIVEDFYQQLRLHKVARDESELGSMGPRQVALDIYRRRPHRRKSAFLHRVVELGCGFAQLESGPDFAHGADLKRVREIWVLQWRPEVESALVEASIHGSSVEEAAANRLLERSRDGGRNSATTVACLVSALVMDLQRIADEFFATVREAIESESDFASAARAVAGLVHLVRYRAVLGAARVPAILELVPVAFRRAVWLIDTLAGLPASQVAASPELLNTENAKAGLVLLRHAALTEEAIGLDASLLADALDVLWPRLGGQPLLQGVVAGLRRQFGRMNDSEMARAIEMAVENTLAGPDTPLGDFLRGLFAARRHAMTEETGLFDAVHRCMHALDEERFLRALPNLRLAFTVFTPREVQRLVHLVERRGQSIPPRPVTGGGNKDLELAGKIDQRVREAMDRLAAR